ncbi:MAG: hypothetical protein ACKVW3_13045 [Phycisphaerales bacterium]
MPPVPVPSDIYVEGDSGNDSTGEVGNPSRPFKAVPVLLVNAGNVTVHISSRVRPFKIENAANVTVKQWAGMTNAEVLGVYRDSEMGGGPGTWTSEDGAWYRDIPLGHDLNLFTGGSWNYDANVNGDGFNYGVLRLETSAIGVQSTNWSIWLDVGARRLWVNLGNGIIDPGSGDLRIGMTAGGNAAWFVACSETYIDDVDAALCLNMNDGQGYGIKFDSCSGNFGARGTFRLRDCGGHAGGILNPAVGSSSCFEGATMDGMRSGGTYLVAYAGSTSVAGVRFRRCSWKFRRWLTPANVEIPYVGPSYHIGILGHTDGGRHIDDVQCEDCVSEQLAAYHTETTPQPYVPYSTHTKLMSAVTAVTFTSHGFRVLRGRVRMLGLIDHYESIAYCRVRFEFPSLGFAMGGDFGRGGMALGFSGNVGFYRGVLVEACEFIVNTDAASGATSTYLYAVSEGNAQDEFIIVNSSHLNVGVQSTANFRVWFNYHEQSFSRFRVRGSAFSHAAGPLNLYGLCMKDVFSGGAANHDFEDNAYYGIATGRYSADPSIESAAQWVAGVDQNGRVLGAQPFTNTPTDCSLGPSSSLRNLVRNTSDLVPSVGINGQLYIHPGSIGAYQYPASSGAGGGSASSRRRMDLSLAIHP